MQTSRVKSLQIVLLGSVCLLISGILSLTFGVRAVPIQELMNVMVHGAKSTMDHLVVIERIPRTVFALLAGAALGVSGVLMQSVTRNPIADPSILGVNTGAALFVVAGMAFFNISSPNQYIWLAIAGSGLTALFVYTVGSLGYGGTTPIKLALSGAATRAALASAVSALVLPRTEVMNIFRFWQVGSVSGATWEGILTVLPFILAGLAVAFLIGPSLDILALGDEMATGLGINTGLVRWAGAVAGVLLCGATTALAGPIGFVGLMVPHIVKILAGPSLKTLVPYSALAGGVLLTLSDVLGRLIGGTGELEAGIITAIIGAPVLICIARKSKV